MFDYFLFSSLTNKKWFLLVSIIIIIAITKAIKKIFWKNLAKIVARLYGKWNGIFSKFPSSHFIVLNIVSNRSKNMSSMRWNGTDL